MALVITFTFAFWSGGKYEQYKIRKIVNQTIESFDEFMEGDEGSVNHERHDSIDIRQAQKEYRQGSGSDESLKHGI